MDLSHPAFAPYRELLAMLPRNRVPTAIELSTVAGNLNLNFQFVESATPLSAFEYERAIQQGGTIPTRPDNMHDFMNALVWLVFPAFKTALNRAHCLSLAENAREAKQRSPLRDALTLLDESGVLVFTEESAFKQLLSRRRWQELFVEKRQSLIEDTRFILVGHSILEKLLAPYPSITGKCLVVSGIPPSITLADQIVSNMVKTIVHPRMLPPMPVAGIPGWHPDNYTSHFYHDKTIFRPLAK